MADILLDVQSPPATPAAGQGVIYIDSVSKRVSAKNDAGTIDTLSNLISGSVAAQGPGFAADTYLAGSSIALQSLVPGVGMIYYCAFDITKTAAGVAQPVVTLRFGTLGTTADAAVTTVTFPAQTAAIDTGMIEVWTLFRTVGAAGVAQVRARLTHGLSITGLSTSVSPVVLATSAGFNTALANAIIGLSLNGGAAAAFTIQLVDSYLKKV